MYLAAGQPKPDAKQLDPLSLMLDSSGVVLVVLLILIVAATAVWLIWFLKSMQLRRLRTAQHRFEKETESVGGASELISLALKHRDSPGGRVVIELAKRHHQPNLSSELLLAVAKRAIASEQQRATSLMPTLSSIASASPFIGLFGTVIGVVQAFEALGTQTAATAVAAAPGMAPQEVMSAIAEALVATAVGLAVAIPAVAMYNVFQRKAKSILANTEALSRVLLAHLVAVDTGTASLSAPAKNTRPAESEDEED